MPSSHSIRLDSNSENSHRPRRTRATSNGDGSVSENHENGRAKPGDIPPAFRSAKGSANRDKPANRMAELRAGMKAITDRVPGNESMKDSHPKLYTKWHALYTELQQLQDAERKEDAEDAISKGEWRDEGQRLLALTNADAQQWAREELAKDTGKLVVTSAADIIPQRVRWVWDLRLPLGTFSLSAGRGGAGKSLHAVWVAARISHGTLPGCWKGKARGVLWVTLEASPEKEVVPRLIAAGADLDLVHFVSVQADDDPANAHLRIFSPAHIDLLHKIVQAKDIGMIVLDPALDVLDSKIKTNDQIEVRNAVSRIQAFAEELEILILGIAHFNKMTTVDDALDRITGSAAFSQRVRAAIVFAYNDVDDVFVISQGKNNWGPLKQPNLAFTHEVRQLADGISTVRLKWQDDDYEHSVQDLLGGKHKQKMSKQDEAYGQIQELLADGPLPKEAIIRKVCELLHCSPSTVEKAAKHLIVAQPLASKGSRGAPGVLWSLPEDANTT